MIALYNIDPQKKYYNNAVEWGEKHKWEKIILNRITTISTDLI